MTERLEAGAANIICPGYDCHRPRVLEDGEPFALAPDGSVVCRECEQFWGEKEAERGLDYEWIADLRQRHFYPQED